MDHPLVSSLAPSFQTVLMDVANSANETTFAELQEEAGDQDRGEGRGQKVPRRQTRRGKGDLEGTHCC